MAKVAGFRSAEALKMATKRGRLGFKVFLIPGRRGKFALTADVAAWLESVDQSD